MIQHVTARKFASLTGWTSSAIIKNLKGQWMIDGKWIEGARLEQTDEGPRWRIPAAEVYRFQKPIPKE